jgi:putative ATP-dependent endonuclease of the OLD family
LDTTKEDMKNIFDSIKKYIPNYFLFKSDRKNTDDDTEIQNPLKIATKNKLCELEEQLKNIQKEIDIFIQGVAIKTIEKFNEFNDQLKIELNAKLETKPWESLFNYSLIGNDNIPLNKRGSGVRRLILLSYFRAEAERLVTDKPAKNIIYAIEEPETSQHPNFQLNILETLLEISNDEKHQVIITTHTPEIAKIIGINSIILIDKNEGNISIHNSSNMNSIKIAECLGILPNLVSKTVLCVEGDNDVKFFRNIFNIPEIKNIFDINKIAIIPMHGSSLVNWINENYFKDSSIKEIHIYDSDVKNYIDKVADMNIKNDGRRKGFITNKNEAENYIKSEYIENEFKIKFNAEDIDNWDKLDIPKYLDGKVNLKEKDIKNIINSKLSKMLTSNDLLNNNSLDEVKVWINAIKDYYEN